MPPTWLGRPCSHRKGSVPPHPCWPCLNSIFRARFITGILGTGACPPGGAPWLVDAVGTAGRCPVAGGVCARGDDMATHCGCTRSEAGNSLKFLEGAREICESGRNWLFNRSIARFRLGGAGTSWRSTLRSRFHRVRPGRQASPRGAAFLEICAGVLFQLLIWLHGEAFCVSAW